MGEYFFFVPVRSVWNDWFKIVGVDNFGDDNEEGDDIYDLNEYE